MVGLSEPVGLDQGHEREAVDMVKYADTDRKPGTYRATFVKLDTDFVLTDQKTGEDVTRWRWVFQDVTDPTTVGEMDTITSPHFKARSNGLKFLTGMLGRKPTEDDDTDTLIGKVFDVQWGPNQNGRMTIIGVLAVNAAPVPATPDPTEQLPF